MTAPTLTEQQRNTLRMLSDGASLRDIAAAGVVSSPKTIRRWRMHSDAFKQAELEMWAPMTEQVGIAARDAVEALHLMLDDADPNIRIKAATVLVNVGARNDKVTQRGTEPAAVIIVSPDDIAAARRTYESTVVDIAPAEPQFIGEDGVHRLPVGTT